MCCVDHGVLCRSRCAVKITVCCIDHSSRLVHVFSTLTAGCVCLCAYSLMTCSMNGWTAAYKGGWCRHQGRGSCCGVYLDWQCAFATSLGALAFNYWRIDRIRAEDKLWREAFVVSDAFKMFGIEVVGTSTACQSGLIAFPAPLSSIYSRTRTLVAILWSTFWYSLGICHK